MMTVSSDMDAVSRVDSYFNNMRLPWEKKQSEEDKNLLFSVGVCDLFSLKSNYLAPSKLSCIRYGKQAISLHYNPASHLFFVGLDDGSVMAYKFSKNKAPYYMEYFKLKVHEKRVMQLSYDEFTKRLYSIGEDGFIKVIDVSKKAIISSKVRLPH